MIQDVTNDILERAVGSLIPQEHSIALACDVSILSDDYEGYIVQSRPGAVQVVSNDGSTPLVATYDVEITFCTSVDMIVARQVNSSGALKCALRDLGDAVKQYLPNDTTLNIINVATSSNEVTITESNKYVFSIVASVTCQPLYLEETEANESEA